MINKLTLRNWKSHENSTFEFKPGVNIIVGSMGAGKSSILQAISFALYGTFSELKSRDIKIADLITRGKGAKRAEIELTLAVSDRELNVKRLISESKSSEAIARDKEGQLLAGTNSTQVSSFLENVLKLDEDLFLRTIYSKQNEIDLFLNLRPGERKQRLDQLMSLDKFEEARKNCKKLINKLETKKTEKQNFLKETNVEKIKQDISTLNKEFELLKEEQQQIKKEFVIARDKKEDLEKQLTALRKKLEQHNKFKGRKGIILQQLEDINTKLKDKDLGKSLSAILTRINDIKTRITETQKTKSTTKTDAENNRTTLLDVEKEISLLEGKNSQLQKQLTETETAKKELAELQEKYGKIEELSEKLIQFQKTIEQKLLQKQTALGEEQALRKSLAELEGVKEGVCPICSSKLDQYTKNKLILERNQKIQELQNTSSLAEEELGKLRKELELLKENNFQQKTLLHKIRAAADLVSQERDSAVKLSELKGKKETLQSIVSQANKRLEQIDEEIFVLDEERAKLLDEKSLYEIKDRQVLLEKELKDIEEKLAEGLDKTQIQDTEKQFQDILTKVQELRSRDNSLVELCKEKEKRLAGLKQKQEQISDLQSGIEKIQKKTQFLHQFKNALRIAQSTLRKELILAVNEVMASSWNALYPYDKWDSIKIEATETDYILQLKALDGQWLSVTGFASGGERMIASLALRIAFAKVLAPNLSLLILDEPTHNLDAQAILALIEVIQEKLSNTLEQVFIVTHDEKLSEAGKNIIKI